MTTRPVAVRVSQATRLVESSVRQASRMASEIWSAILSGWPSVTDSEVNNKRFLDGNACLLKIALGMGQGKSLNVFSNARGAQLTRARLHECWPKALEVGTRGAVRAAGHPRARYGRDTGRNP